MTTAVWCPPKEWPAQLARERQPSRTSDEPNTFCSCMHMHAAWLSHTVLPQLTMRACVRVCVLRAYVCASERRAAYWITYWRCSQLSHIFIDSRSHGFKHQKLLSPLEKIYAYIEDACVCITANRPPRPQSHHTPDSAATKVNTANVQCLLEWGLQWHTSCQGAGALHYYQVFILSNCPAPLCERQLKRPAPLMPAYCRWWVTAVNQPTAQASAFVNDHPGSFTNDMVSLIIPDAIMTEMFEGQFIAFT